MRADKIRQGHVNVRENCFLYFNRWKDNLKKSKIKKVVSYFEQLQQIFASDKMIFSLWMLFHLLKYLLQFNPQCWLFLSLSSSIIFGIPWQYFIFQMYYNFRQENKWIYDNLVNMQLYCWYVALTLTTSTQINTSWSVKFHNIAYRHSNNIAAGIWLHTSAA